MSVSEQTQRGPTPASRTTPRPAEHAVVVEQGLRIPMPDGVELSAMLWRPDTPSRYPVLVERVAYPLAARTGPAGNYHAARGYVVLGVSLRGRGESDGHFTGRLIGSLPGDATATIEWTARQPWSNGQIGMICGSMSGWTQYQTATEAPQSLRALLARQGPLFRGVEDFWPGGAFPLTVFQGISATLLAQQRPHMTDVAASRADYLIDQVQTDRLAVARHLPLSPHPLFTGVADFYDDWVGHPPEDPWWDEWDLRRLAEHVRVPICHVGGWFDTFIHSTLAAFSTLGQRAATPAARDGQRLIVGPWVHGPEHLGDTHVGQLDLGPNAALDYFAFRQRWYDQHLRGQATGIEGDPRVWLYLIGADEWLGCDTWPPPGMVATSWYLHGSNGSDAFTPDAPMAAEPATIMTSDPDDPVPSLSGGGPFGMSLDQTPLEDRLVTYTSPPLARPLTLIGPLSAELHIAANVPDVDLVVRLSWVRPDGVAVIISGGIARARYRHGRSTPTLLAPGQPARCVVEMMPLSVAIPAGHRLRLSLAGSDFPSFDRNLHTGGPIGREATGQPATTHVLHGPTHPSRVLLPVIIGDRP